MNSFGQSKLPQSLAPSQPASLSCQLSCWSVVEDLDATSNAVYGQDIFLFANICKKNMEKEVEMCGDVSLDWLTLEKCKSLLHSKAT